MIVSYCCVESAGARVSPACLDQSKRSGAVYLFCRIVRDLDRCGNYTL